MIKFSWHESKVPANIKITQVYGIIFTTDGRTLLRVENKPDKKYYCLAGGTPEDFDADMIATLKRELIEEVNTTIHDPVYLGYQLVENDGDKPPYAQVRMVAIIDKIGKKQPDPDNGKTYDRLLTTPQNAIKLLNWVGTGEKMFLKATEVAKSKLCIKFDCDKDEFV